MSPDEKARAVHSAVLALMEGPLSADELAPAVEYLLRLESRFAKAALQEALTDGTATWHAVRQKRRGRPPLSRFAVRGPSLVAPLAALICALLSAPVAAQQYREHTIWMTLPDHGDTTGKCLGEGPPIYYLQLIEGKAISFNPNDTDTIGGAFQIYGMEGDSVGVAWDIRPGVMGSMWYRVRNTAGWSCWVEYVYAVPYSEDSIPPPPDPPDSTGLSADYYSNEDWTALYDSPPDSVIQFYWGHNPPLAGMSDETFSVEWVGMLDVPSSGGYRLCVEGCNGGWTFDFAGSRLSSWEGTGCNEICVLVGLTAGDRYDAVIRYHHSTGYAACSMRWINPNSQSQYIPPDAWRP